MAAEAQAKIQHNVEKMLDKLEKEKLRPLLLNAHLGSAKCCENQIISKEQLEQCMQSSFQPAQQVQEAIGRELNQFQERLGRCAKSCQDDVQDKMSGVNPSPNDVAKLQGELDGCISKCCDNHIELIPKMMLRINQIIQQVQP